MDQPKPIAGLVVVLFVVTVIGGWLYVDSVRNELDARLDALEARETAQVAGSGIGRLTAPTDENGWHMAASGPAHSYSLRLPPGYHLTPGSSDYDYVVPDPTPEEDNLMPVMTITVRPTAAAETHPGKMIQAGSRTYWLSLYENLEWLPYDQVVESFMLL